MRGSGLFLGGGTHVGSRPHAVFCAHWRQIHHDRVRDIISGFPAELAVDPELGAGLHRLVDSAWRPPEVEDEADENGAS